MTEFLKYSPIVTRAVAVIEVSMVASNSPNARLNHKMRKSENISSGNVF